MPRTTPTPSLPPRRAAGAVAALLLGLAACTGQAGEAGDTKAPTMSSTAKPAEPAGRMSAATLAALFPSGLGSWALKRLDEPTQHPDVPVPVTSVKAAYAQGTQEVEITATAGQPTGAAKGSREVYREQRAAKGDTLVVLTLPNGLALAATSRSADAAALEALLRQLDLVRAEALQP